jgi:hypothetical protein
MYNEEYEVNLVEQWVHFNQLYVGVNFDLYTKNLKFNEGKVVFSAPHSAQTINEDSSVRAPEFAVGSLAQTLAEITGNGFLANLGFWNGMPNKDPLERCYFKQTLLNLKPSFVFNLHGMKNAYGPDICIATGDFSEKYRELTDSMISLGEVFGFNVALNSPFDGRESGTVVQTLNNHKIDALQVSISANLRNIYGEDTQLPSELLEYFKTVLANMPNSGQ